MRYSHLLGYGTPLKRRFMSFSSHQAFLSGPPQPLVVCASTTGCRRVRVVLRLAPPNVPRFSWKAPTARHHRALFIFRTRPLSHPDKPRAGIPDRDRGDRSGAIKGSGIQALQQALAESTITKPEGLPPFYGGAVGYLSYDLVRSFELLPTLAADDLHLPELHMAFFDVVARSITIRDSST
jgi:anthranilate/para-aminobenzoate synthase component I